jgi:hypothetical protein
MIAVEIAPPKEVAELHLIQYLVYVGADVAATTNLEKVT